MVLGSETAVGAWKTSSCFGPCFAGAAVACSHAVVVVAAVEVSVGVAPGSSGRRYSVIY